MAKDGKAGRPQVSAERHAEIDALAKADVKRVSTERGEMRAKLAETFGGATRRQLNASVVLDSGEHVWIALPDGTKLWARVERLITHYAVIRGS